MTKIEMKKEFKQRFAELFPNKRLLAIQLNGFTHTVFYDEKSPRAKVTNFKTFIYSGCMGKEELRTMYPNNYSDQLDNLFSGYPNYSYQNNAQEIVYIRP